MIRFVDLTAAYWAHPDHGGPCCAFLDTRTDTFVANDFGPVFDSLDEVRAIPDVGERCAGLVPDGFFEKMSTRPAALSAEFIADSFGTTSWSVGFFWKGDEPHKYFFLNDLTETEAKRRADDLNIAAAGKRDVAVAEMLADNDRLRAILAGDMPKLKNVVFPDPTGAFAMRFTPHWTLNLLAHTLGELVGPNYSESVEIQATHPEKGRLVLTIQRVLGKTPHELKLEAEARADALQKRLDAALAFAGMDPFTRSVLRTLTPEMVEAYLRGRGWTGRSCLPNRAWTLGSDRVVVPLCSGAGDYAHCVFRSLTAIGEAEKRPALAVYIDMLDAPGAG